VVRGWARERDAAPHLFPLPDNPPRWQRVTNCRSSVLYDWSRPVPLYVLGEEPRPSGTAEASAQANTQVKILALPERVPVDFSSRVAYDSREPKTNVVDPGLECQVFAARGM
jgi:hypothetical protein